VLPPDVQESHWDHRLDPLTAPEAERRTSTPAMRLGLRIVKGLSEESGRRIEAARPFRDPEDLRRRAALHTRELGFLARAGALKSLVGHRYQAHWEVAALHKPTELERVAETPGAYEGSGIELTAPGTAEDMLDDYRYASLTLGPHPLRLLRDDPALRGSLQARALEGCRHGQPVQVAGLVTGRQRPSSASGVVFVTLEDETGNVNVVVWTSVLDRFRAALLQGQLLKIKGVVEREKEVIHVVAGHVADATELLAQLSAKHPSETPFRSRDFR
jgi:error-prone DNA polymerase